MILIGLDYLHGHDIMHRDLSPRNVLVDLLPNGFKVLKITDFGLSKKATKLEVYSTTLAELTTKQYISPEVIRGGKPTSKVDIWALGILLFQLVAK